VPAFVDRIMAEVYPADAQQRFRAGFEEFESAMKTHAGGTGFLEQDAEQRKAALQQAIQAALDGEFEHKPFVLVARELTLLGFYTSQVGITENMEYQPVPGAYRGCVPLSQMKKPVHWE
jgi:hypothetical protein